MFTYCLLTGWRLGYLDDSYRDTGIRAYRGLVKEFVTKKRDGTMSLTKCCSVSGLGPESNPKRDGSFEYYMSEPVRDNDAKGIGPFIWASLEMERMGFTVQNLDTFQSNGIQSIKRQESAEAPCYDLSGRRTTSRSRSIYIQSGRKFWNK